MQRKAGDAEGGGHDPRLCTQDGLGGREKGKGREGGSTPGREHSRGRQREGEER